MYGFIKNLIHLSLKKRYLASTWLDVVGVSMFARKHDLVVLDLDFTLWSFRVDDCIERLEHDEHDREYCNIVDKDGKFCALYPETLSVLEYLKERNYQLAIASRIENICVAYHFLHSFKIAHYFSHKEIMPVSKAYHFSLIKEFSKVPYNRMVFFDDDDRNIRCASNLGISAVKVISGITLDLVKKHLP